MSHVITDNTSEPTNFYTVECVRLPDVLAQVGVNVSRVGLIKFDVEGAEYRILPSMGSWLMQHNLPAIWLSIHVPLWPQAGTESHRQAVFEVMNQYPFLYSEDLRVVPPLERTVELVSGITAFLLSPHNFTEPFDAFRRTHVRMWEEDNAMGTNALMNITYPGTEYSVVVNDSRALGHLWHSVKESHPFFFTAVRDLVDRHATVTTTATGEETQLLHCQVLRV